MKVRRTDEGGKEDPKENKDQGYDDAKKHPKGYDGDPDHIPPNTGDWNGAPGEYFTNKFPPPAVPKNDEQSGGGVRVSTAALRTFATNLRALIPPLKTVKAELEKIKLAPGAFYDAGELTNKLLGGQAGQGLVVTTSDFVKKAINAITVSADELEKLADAYKTAEELNAATGKDLAEHIQSAKTYINQAAGGASQAAGGAAG
ncbi:hypothetical protein ALI144C_33185 [Actinosynnema sp. ALI-1.44]|nr:hypothetical protein ALI144C_33185 [Actinosynnema sp. ALI-1.44]